VIHQVKALPVEGIKFIRAKCGFATDDHSLLAETEEDIPEGAAKCRRCWRSDEPTDRTKLKQIKAHLDGPELDREVIRAILEGRFYTENRRSPKAA